MSWGTTLYHKEHAPKGRTFEAGSHSQVRELERAKAKEGWVDHPGKVGINLWGEHANLEALARMESDYRAGRIPAIDDNPDTTIPEETPEQKAVKDALAAKEGIREKESLPKRAKMEKEELADTRRSQGRDAKTGERKRTAVKKKRTTARKAAGDGSKAS